MDTCEVCDGPIYRRPNCVTCSARCSRILRAHKSLAGRPCAVCERPIPSHRGGNAVTCSAECYRTHNRRMQAIRNRRSAGRPEGISYDPVAARHFITMRLDHQWPGAFFGGART